MSEQTSTKSLALFITNDSITYLTKSTQDEENFYSEPVRISLPDLKKHQNYEDIESLVKSHLPLLLYYNKVFICYLSTPVSVVPKAYITEEIKHFLKLNADPKLLPISAPLKYVDACVVFNGYSPLAKVLQNLANFKSAKFIHTGNLLIDRLELNAEKNQIFARLIEQKLEICIYKQRTFMFYNVFDITADEDILYYILNSIEQLKLNPLETFLTFEGGIDENHLAMEHLPKYIQEVTIDPEAHSEGLKYLLYKIFECE